MTNHLWTGEAPGRLDVMGGVGDYSGSLVLQMPIRATTHVTIAPTGSEALSIVSEQEGEATLPLHELRPLAETDNASDVRAWLDEKRVPHWARYCAGCLLLFGRAMDWWPQSGLSFHIESNVPASMGVSSSAALEVATLRALEQASGRSFSGTMLARLAQQAENEIVGAPCGLMDQLAAAHGVAGALLPILCRPDVLDEPVPLPRSALVVGWPSGVKHAVSASPYATARAAAFMGKKILEAALARKLGYLTELAPSVLRGVETALPETLRGSDFLARYGGVDDPLAAIEPETAYPVRAAAAFAVEENFRVQSAVQLMRGVSEANREAVLRCVGELMFQAHAGYNRIGLGSPETDAMAQAVRDLGAQRGFYGARISGGGSGGTVAVLLEQSALPDLEKVAQTTFFSPDGPLPLIL